ncbi:MAG: hypothetical protein F6J87_27875 [Spirulina sp. SIO3F2]|nr:hypothetical protein [Spirulina sp. SIO3F2]
MQESVFYQDLVQEVEQRTLEQGRREGREEGLREGEKRGIIKGEQRGIRKGYLRLLRQLMPFLQGFNVPIQPLLKRLGVTQAELETAELDD